MPQKKTDANRLKARKSRQALARKEDLRAAREAARRNIGRDTARAEMALAAAFAAMVSGGR